MGQRNYGGMATGGMALAALMMEAAIGGSPLVRVRRAETPEQRRQALADRLGAEIVREQPIIEAAEAKRARKNAQRLKARTVQLPPPPAHATPPVSTSQGAAQPTDANDRT